MDLYLNTKSIKQKSEKRKFKYFKNTKQQRNLRAIYQLSTN